MTTPTQDEIRQVIERLRELGGAHWDERSRHVKACKEAADLLSRLAQQDAVGVVDRVSTPTGWGFQNGPRLYSDDLPVGTLLYAAPVPVAQQEPISEPHPHDWPEDFPHENGRYMCNCVECGITFFGHKRRATCKKCAAPVPAPKGEEGK